MGSQVNIRSIQALRDLKGAVDRFDQESIAALRAAEQELQATERWLQERLAYWQAEVQRRDEAERLATAALLRCQASGYYDPQTGAYHAPDCRAQQYAVTQAKARLQEAQGQMSNVQTWKRMVSQAATEYRDQVIQVTRTLPTILPSARAFLGNKVTELETYVAATTPGDTSAAPVSTSAPSPSGIQLASLTHSDIIATIDSQGSWTSPNGLVYSKEITNRVEHILRHAHDNPSRGVEHGVFDEKGTQIIALIDEAWSKRYEPVVVVEQQGVNRTQYNIPLGKRIGYVGGMPGAARGHPECQWIRIIIEGKTNIISCFPVVEP